MIQNTHEVIVKFKDDGVEQQCFIAIGNADGVDTATDETIFFYCETEDDFRKMFLGFNGEDFRILREVNSKDPNVYSWWRLGCSAVLTKSELDRLNDGDSDLLVELFKAGRFTLDGESYIPGDCDCLGEKLYNDEVTVNV